MTVHEQIWRESRFHLRAHPAPRALVSAAQYSLYPQAGWFDFNTRKPYNTNDAPGFPPRQLFRGLPALEGGNEICHNFDAGRCPNPSRCYRANQRSFLGCGSFTHGPLTTLVNNATALGLPFTDFAANTFGNEGI